MLSLEERVMLWWARPDLTSKGYESSCSNLRACIEPQAAQVLPSSVFSLNLEEALHFYSYLRLIQSVTTIFRSDISSQNSRRHMRFETDRSDKLTEISSVVKILEMKR